MSEPKITIDLSEYNALCDIKHKYEEKLFYGQIDFCIQNRVFHPHWHQKFYYKNENLTIPDEIKNLQVLISECIKECTPIEIPEVKKDIVFNKIIKWFRHE